MKTTSYGTLINKAGNGKYTNQDAPENLIRYITRTNGEPKNDLIAWGGLGILEYQSINSIIDQFSLVQQLHTRNGGFGRLIDHEIFSFTPECESLLDENNVDIDRLAREMAYTFYETDHCQVLYGVHSPSKEDAHLHVHFAINTVSFETGNKRRENISQTRERNTQLQNIIAARLPNDDM